MRSFSDRVLDALAPIVLASADLDTYVRAQGETLFQDIEDLASDSDNDDPGWSALVDLDRIPDIGLEYLAQFKGVTIPPGLTADQKRQRIQETDGWNRGAPSAIAAAPLPYITGTQTVIVRERDANACPALPAYGLTVITRFSETTDSAAVLKALVEQKPAGIILNYEVLQGQDYLMVYQGYATYQSVFTSFATYQDLLAGTVGGGGSATFKSGADTGHSSESASARVFVSGSDASGTATESASANNNLATSYGLGDYGSGQYGH